ncbi:MAG TPA: NmrA family NAD(P)-binding protein [Chthoniobacter sp.]
MEDALLKIMVEADGGLMKSPIYAIMGITGQVGGAIARALLRDGKSLRGIVRDKSRAAHWTEQGVELVSAEATDAASLEAAFRDVDGVFAMLPPAFAPAPGFPDARAQIAALHQALEAVRPNRVVTLSSIGAQQDHGLGLITQLHMLEQELGTLPVPNAFVRPGWFLENSLWDVAPARERGRIDAYLAPLDRPFPMVATEDIGQLVAATLQQEWSGLRYLELEGPRRYSQIDAAQTFARLLGKPVTAVPVPREQWPATFEAQGTAPDRTSARIEMLDGFNSGWIEFERGRTEHSRGSRTMEEVFRDLLQRA